MFFITLLLINFNMFGAASPEPKKTVTIEGNLCIPYCQPSTVEQLGPYREYCLNAFDQKHEKPPTIDSAADILAHEPLQKLWIPVRAFCDTSKDWANFGHPDINKGSRKFGETFPWYMPLSLFLYTKLDEEKPIKLTLSVANQRIQAKLWLCQEPYSDEAIASDNLDFALAKNMLKTILRRHYAFCQMQLWRVPPKTELEGKDERILKEKFGDFLKMKAAERLPHSPRLTDISALLLSDD